MSGRTQRGAVVELGLDPDNLTDFSDEIASFTIPDNRNTVARRATYGFPDERTSAAGHVRQVNIDFDQEEGDPNGTFAMLRAAQATESAECYFRVRYKDEDVSDTNPEYTGSFVVTGIMIGTAVNQWKSQTQTYPVNDFAEDTGS